MSRFHVRPRGFFQTTILYYPDMASSPQPNKYEGAGFLVHDNDPRIGLTSFPSISPPPPSHQQSTSTPFSMRAFPFVALGIAACLFGQALAFIPPGSVCAPSPYAASSTVGLAKTHTHLIRSTICSGMLQPRKWRVGWGRPAISIGGSEEYGGVRRDGRGRSGRILNGLVWIQTMPLVPARLLTHNFMFPPPRAHMSSTQALPALIAALAEERLDRQVLLERARWVSLEMKEKETELKEKETELTKLKLEMKDQERDLKLEVKDKETELEKGRSELLKARTAKDKELEMLKNLNLRLLKIEGDVSLRAALGKSCRNFGERTSVLINFYLGGSQLSLFPFTHNTPTHRIFSGQLRSAGT